jgi:hypothetical protein
MERREIGGGICGEWCGMGGFDGHSSSGHSHNADRAEVLGALGR